MRNTRSQWFPAWIWPVFLVLTIGSVWVRLSVVKTTYDVTQADKTLRSLQQDREQIELRVAGLRSPRRLEITWPVTDTWSPRSTSSFCCALL